jgi:elongation factor Ts
MAVSAQLVKELREKTGAGMLDCKKALDATDGNIDKAIDYLRENGIAKAAKKADRIAAEGLTNVVSNETKAVLYEVNSETDFVAKNREFLDLIDEVGTVLLNGDATNLEEALNLKAAEGTLADVIVKATARIGEKLSLRRVTFVFLEAGQTFGSYVHMGGKISSLVVLKGGEEEVARDVAMHVAANNPQYLDESQVSEDVIEHERSVLRSEALNEGKPEAIVDKMVEGRLNKMLKDICLIHQPFVKNPDLTVANFVKNASAEIVRFERLGVGEGVEKKEEDFAKEVQAQMNA